MSVSDVVSEVVETRISLVPTRVSSIEAISSDAALSYVPGFDMQGYGNADPKYWLMTREGLRIVFGITGLVESISTVSGNSVISLLSRPNAYGKFQ
ncbi:MAG: hypothetical protein WC254_01430 [Candidatus Woesearchaeota archaeon]|jgi:hypothetical protein